VEGDSSEEDDDLFSSSEEVKCEMIGKPIHIITWEAS